MQYEQIISLLLKCLASSSQKNLIYYCDSQSVIGKEVVYQKKKDKEALQNQKPTSDSDCAYLTSSLSGFLLIYRSRAYFRICSLVWEVS